MGTSKRKIDEKIMKMLKEKGVREIDETVPELTVEFLSTRKLKSFVGEDEFKIVLGCGIKGINAILSGNFSEQFDYDGEISTDKKTIQQLIDAIMSSVNEEDLESDLLIRALKYAIPVAIQEESENKVIVFINEFCYFLLYLIVFESIIEALGEEYEGQATDIDDQVKNISRKIVESTLNEDIRNYISDKISLEALIEAIMEKASNVKLGDF